MMAPRKPLTFDLGDMEANLRQPEPVVPPEPPKDVPVAERQQLGVRIAKDVYKRLRIKAVADEVLVQDVVERAIRELLEREDG